MYLSMINRAVALAKRGEVKGDVCEFGVFQAGGFCVIGRLLKEYGMYDDRHMFGFDTFAGMPETEVVSGDFMDHEWAAGVFGNTSLEAVEARVKAAGLKATFIKGKFDPSVPLSDYGIDKIALAHIDCDIYEGYRDALKWITPHLQVGSVILCDESEPPPDPRYFFGVRAHGQRALHDWWTENDIALFHVKSVWTIALYVVVDKDYLTKHAEWIAKELMPDNALESVVHEFRLDKQFNTQEVIERLKAMGNEIQGMVGRAQEE